MVEFITETRLWDYIVHVDGHGRLTKVVSKYEMKAKRLFHFEEDARLVDIMLVGIGSAFVFTSFLALTGAMQDTKMLLPDTTGAPVTDVQSKDHKFGNGTKISYSLYLKALSYVRKSAAFQNLTKGEMLAFFYELENWEAPEVIRKSMPYYLAGSDFEGRPVWVSEFGKYDFGSVVKMGPNAIPLMEKYSFQFIWRVIKSLHARDTADTEVREVVLIVDCEGLDLTLLKYTSVLEFTMRIVRDHREVIAEITGSVVAINVNYVARIFFGLLRPVMGSVYERVQLHGTTRATWLPKLRQLLPDDSLPPWYGGKEDFKPEEIY